MTSGSYNFIIAFNKDTQLYGWEMEEEGKQHQQQHNYIFISFSLSTFYRFGDS